jgi:polar amino acid transport system substrate-binding protein
MRVVLSGQSIDQNSRSTDPGGQKSMETSFQSFRQSRKVFKLVLISLVFATLMVPIAPVAQAASCTDTLTTAKDANYIRMSSYQQPPHGWFDLNSGKYQGVDVEIITGVLKHIGIANWDYVTADWGAMIPGLQACRWDIMSIGMTYTKLRSQQVTFSVPVYQYGTAMIVAKGNPKKIKGKKQWPGKKIGGIIGSTDDQVIGGVKGAKYVPFTKYSDLYRALSTGRIDAAMVDELQLGYDFKLQPQSKISVVNPWQGKAVGLSAIVMRNGDTGLVSAVNDALHQMRSDGTLKAILLKYKMPPTAYVTCDAPKSYTSDGIAQCL